MNEACRSTRRVCVFRFLATSMSLRLEGRTHKNPMQWNPDIFVHPDYSKQFLDSLANLCGAVHLETAKVKLPYDFYNIFVK